MKKITGIAAILLALCNFAFSENFDLEKSVNSSFLKELKEKGQVSLIHEKNDKKMSMVPDCFFTDEIKKNLLCEKDSGVPFLAEFLYLIPKNQLNSDVSKVNTEKMALILRSISKMQGMTYIHNGGKSDILYKKCFAIENAESMTPIADPLEGPTDGLTAFAYQHDHTFGDTKYKLTYHQNDSIIYAQFLNVMPMGKLGVKAIMPENMRMHVMSIDAGDNLLLYLATDVSAKNIIGIRGQIEDSMTVRMDAVYRWFMKQFQ